MTPQKESNRKRYVILILIALLVAFLAVVMAQNAQDTADINNVYAPVVNNTDLYPDQRVEGVTYWANDSPIDIYLIFHATGIGASQAFDSNLSINGTVLQDNDFNTVSGVGFHDHWSLSARIPKGANYTVTNSSNVYDIEWREYLILSGKDGTLSVNQTFVGSSFNATYDAYGSSKVNKSGDTMTGELNITVTDGTSPKNIMTLGLDSAGTNATLFLNPVTDAFNFRVNQNLTGGLTNITESGWSLAFRATPDTWGVTHMVPGMPFAESIIQGTGNATIAYKGNQSLVDAGKGIILKSPDGTKCGILTWTNADTLASTSITCP